MGGAEISGGLESGEAPAGSSFLLRVSVHVCGLKTGHVRASLLPQKMVWFSRLQLRLLVSRVTG